MKNKIISIVLLASIVVIAIVVFKPADKKEFTKDDVTKISTALKSKLKQIEGLQQVRQKRPSAQVNENKLVMKNPHPDLELTDQQSIIGVIYKKPDSTWFFKAKNSKDKIDAISASFKNYFVDQLKFNPQNQPIFSHIPDSMKAENTSPMRVATYKLGEVEVSVSKLSGQQDVYANVRRWMKQVGLDDSSKISLNFSEDKKTITVKMPR